MVEESQSLDPVVARRRLRNALRRLRETAGLTQRQVAVDLGWPLARILRIETGQVATAEPDLLSLLRRYGATADHSADLVELARIARQRAWWSVYRGIASAEYLAYINLESSANVIRNFEPTVVPRLLQTVDYARETMLWSSAGFDAQLLELHMARQERLTRPDGPEMHFILDQSVVERVVGGPALMRRQLRHIRRVAEYPNVTVRIVPWDVGLYSNYDMAYVLLEFGNHAPDALFRQTPNGEMVAVQDPEEDATGDYLASFWGLERVAAPEHAVELLDSATAAMTRAEERSRSGAPSLLEGQPMVVSQPTEGAMSAEQIAAELDGDPELAAVGAALLDAMTRVLKTIDPPHTEAISAVREAETP